VVPWYIIVGLLNFASVKLSKKLISLIHRTIESLSYIYKILVICYKASKSEKFT